MKCLTSLNKKGEKLKHNIVQKKQAKRADDNAWFLYYTET